MELNKLIENVQQWSIDRGLDKADSKKQLLKLYEEFGELASGIAKNKPEVIMDSIGDCVVVLIILAQQLEIKGINSEQVIYIDYKDNMIGLSSFVGDISFQILNNLQATLTKESIAKTLTLLKIVAKYNGFKFEDCLEMAWNAIKDRKGKLINGIWVAEKDLPKEVSPEQTLDAIIENDVVNNPSHYQGRNGLEALEVMRQFAPCPEYIEGGYWSNIIKYILRYHKKNGVEDLKKARKNLDWLIEELEHGQKNQN